MRYPNEEDGVAELMLLELLEIISEGQNVLYEVMKKNGNKYPPLEQSIENVKGYVEVLISYLKRSEK